MKGLLLIFFLQFSISTKSYPQTPISADRFDTILEWY